MDAKEKNWKFESFQLKSIVDKEKGRNIDQLRGGEWIKIK